MTLPKTSFATRNEPITMGLISQGEKGRKNATDIQDAISKN